MNYECPTCHRATDRTDGTDIGFWCQVCGAEISINEMRPYCVALLGRIEKRIALLERVQRRQRVIECVSNITKHQADSIVGATSLL